MAFTLVQEPYGSYWLHSDGRHFISFYEAVGRNPAHFHAYTSKAHPPKGRYPWTVDNRRVGTDLGFQTLAAAMQACQEA